MSIIYDELRKIARETLTEMIERDEIEPGKKRIRRKSPDPKRIGVSLSQDD